MIPLRDIYNEARKEDEDLDIEELAEIILDSVESEFPEIVSQMDLPQRNIKLEIAKKRSKRLKREEGIRQIRNETERSNLISSLNLIKEEISYEKFTQIENEYQHPLLFQKSVDDYYSPIKEFTTSFDDISLMQKNDEPLHYKPFSSADIVKIAKSLSNKISDYNLVYDKTYDRILNIEVELDAKEALELWIKILDETEGEYKKSVNLEWSGEFNLTDDEYVNYSVEIMLKANTGPRAVENFDLINAIREGRD